jgi:hypothetical protein
MNPPFKGGIRVSDFSVPAQHIFRDNTDFVIALVYTADHP